MDIGCNKAECNNADNDAGMQFPTCNQTLIHNRTTTDLEIRFLILEYSKPDMIFAKNIPSFTPFRDSLATGSSLESILKCINLHPKIGCKRLGEKSPSL